MYQGVRTCKYTILTTSNMLPNHLPCKCHLILSHAFVSLSQSPLPRWTFHKLRRQLIPVSLITTDSQKTQNPQTGDITRIDSPDPDPIHPWNNLRSVVAEEESRQN